MIFNYNTVEGFIYDNTSIIASNISDYIYKVYKADVKAIQNLADIAIKLLVVHILFVINNLYISYK